MQEGEEQMSSSSGALSAAWAPPDAWLLPSTRQRFSRLHRAQLTLLAFPPAKKKSHNSALFWLNVHDDAHFDGVNSFSVLINNGDKRNVAHVNTATENALLKGFIIII